MELERIRQEAIEHEKQAQELAKIKEEQDRLKKIEN